MLSFSEEDKARIAASQQRRGKKGTSLASDVQANGGGSSRSLADAWLNFLEEATAEQGAADGPQPVASPSDRSGSLLVGSGGSLPAAVPLVSLAR